MHKQRPTTLVIRQMRLSAIRGPLKGKRYAFSTLRIRVGKAEDNDIIIPADTVSRHHFEIVRNIRGFLVRDLESTNGTLLDGAHIREAYIRPGSIISAGGSRLKFSIGEIRKEPDLFSGHKLGPLVFKSSSMRRLAEAAREIALSDLPVLVLGEAGTGKKTYCKAVHGTGQRRNHPFVLLNAASGLEKENATIRSGDLKIPKLVRDANEGSLVIEEPWELDKNQQSLLIKSLEKLPNKKGEPAVRLFATTSRRLSVEVDKKKMDGPLASYLSSIRIHIPPLRQRPQDIEILMDLFAYPEKKDPHGSFPSFLADLFYRFRWPENISELKTMMEDLTSFEGLIPGKKSISSASFENGLSFREHKKRWVESFERSYLKWLIHRCHGNVSGAARHASMDRKHLNKLLKRHGIKS